MVGIRNRIISTAIVIDKDINAPYRFSNDVVDPNLVKQEALVSFIYPYFQPVETLVSQDSVYDLTVTYIPPPMFYDIEENETMQSVDIIYQVFAKSIKQEINTVESLHADNSIIAVFAKDILRAINYSESLEAKNSIYEIKAPSVGLYSGLEESISSVNSIYQIYAGAI